MDARFKTSWGENLGECSGASTLPPAENACSTFGARKHSPKRLPYVALLARRKLSHSEARRIKIYSCPQQLIPTFYSCPRLLIFTAAPLKTTLNTQKPSGNPGQKDSFRHA